MPALQVRDFPDELYERLKASAAKNHRSIAQQTVAFVEAQLQQEDAKDVAILAPDFSVPFITPNVREASVRACDVDPFDWLRDFDEEPKEVLEARRKKRRQLRGQAKKLSKAWIGPKPTAEQIAEMVRDEREGRANRIMKIAKECHDETGKSHDGA